jgi:hypothetical protein
VAGAEGLDFRPGSSQLTGNGNLAGLPGDGVEVEQRGAAGAARPLGQVDLPDVTDPAFVQAAARQARIVAANPGEVCDQAFIDAVSLDRGP